MADLTITLDLFDDPHTVEFDPYPWSWADGNCAHVDGVVGTIGAGSARYPTSITLWRVTDDRPAHRGNRTAIASDGSVWQFNLGCVIRNRNNARVVGWADVVGATNDQTQART